MSEPSRVPRDRVELAFVPVGKPVFPQPGQPAGSLYLDVGSSLRPGVIDHHQLLAFSGSTTRLVHTYPDLLDASVKGRSPEAPLTLYLHEWPDLDAVAAAFLAREYLCEGRFPDGAEGLVRYVDRVDSGTLGATRANPFSLYCAYQVLADRPVAGPAEEHWRACVRDGLVLIGHVVRESARPGGPPLEAIDALAVPGLFAPSDRDHIGTDLERYERKLADAECGARIARLELPDLLGRTEAVELLLVRDVQNEGDPDRCLFFKDWARSDTARSPETNGFVALAVYHTEGDLQHRRCIISVRPDGQATLRGLGALLDQAEGARRRQLHGVDDREIDPATRAPVPPRPGYPNADPWYDGRGHGFTIVDSPRTGTVLTEAEIEQVILAFGRCTVAPRPLV
jgi:hypothetical protein